MRRLLRILTAPARWLNDAERDALADWNRIGCMSNDDIDRRLK